MDKLPEQAESVRNFVDTYEAVKIEALAKSFPKYNISKIIRFLVFRGKICIDNDKSFVYSPHVRHKSKKGKNISLEQIANNNMQNTEAVLDFIEVCRAVTIEQVQKAFPDTNITAIAEVLKKKQYIYQCKNAKYLYCAHIGLDEGCESKDVAEYILNNW